MSVLKKDLARLIQAEYPEYTIGDLEEVVEVIFEEMAQALEEKRRIEIRGFGAFCCHRQKARCFINPKNGRETRCPSSYRIVFRPGRDLTEIIPA